MIDSHCVEIDDNLCMCRYPAPSHRLKNRLTPRVPYCMVTLHFTRGSPARRCSNYNGLRDRIATRSSLELHPARLFLPSVL